MAIFEGLIEEDWLIYGEGGLMHSVYKNANSFTKHSLIDPFFFPFPVNLSNLSAKWAYKQKGAHFRGVSTCKEFIFCWGVGGRGGIGL